MDILNKIVTVDWSALKPELVKAINEGKAIIRDGVAYLPNGKIIQHLPFKEVMMPDIAEAIKVVQATTMVAAAVSTGIILAAIVVQTRYLAAKLDKIQETVDDISKDVHAHNILFYMDKITQYVGHVEVARTLLKDRSLSNEIHELAYPLLTTLASTRNQVMSFVDNILILANSSSDVTPKHFELILNFVQSMLDILPAGIHIEYLLTARIGKLRLAEHILLDGEERFNAALNIYRAFMNDLHRDLIKGEIGERKSVYQSIEKHATQLFNSQENKIFLSLPMGRMTPMLSSE